MLWNIVTNDDDDDDDDDDYEDDGIDDDFGMTMMMVKMMVVKMIMIMVMMMKVTAEIKSVRIVFTVKASTHPLTPLPHIRSSSISTDPSTWAELRTIYPNRQIRNYFIYGIYYLEYSDINYYYYYYYYYYCGSYECYYDSN